MRPGRALDRQRTRDTGGTGHRRPVARGARAAAASWEGRHVKRAALYARVSTDEQAEKGYGLGSQLRALREAAATRGYDVAAGAEFVDDGYSGALVDRPA